MSESVLLFLSLQVLFYFAFIFMALYFASDLFLDFGTEDFDEDFN